MLKKIVIYLLYIIVIHSDFISANNFEKEDDLRRKILYDYDSSLSPLLYATDSQFTYIYFVIFRIQGLDEKKGEFITEGPVVQIWTDERLTWDDSNVMRLKVLPEDIWVPSFHVYNSIGNYDVTLASNVFIMQRAVGWVPRYVLRTAYKPNLRYFPFETQECNIIMGLSSKEGDIIPTNFSSAERIHTVTVDDSLMIENPQWIKESIKVELREMKVDSDTVRDVAFYTFTIRRSMPLIPLGILTPCLSCTLLLLTTFWMQAGSTLRTGINATAMLVSSSSLFTLGKVLPVSGSSTPIIVEYVSITLILSTVSSIQTMLTSVLNRCEKLPPVSYAIIISKIPSLFLYLMGISPNPVLSQNMDQNFLFSELEDSENPADFEIEITTGKSKENDSLQSVQSLWIKYIILLDRVMFYVFGIIILLFVISVIVTE